MRALISSVAALLLTLGLAERSAAQTATATPPTPQPQTTQPQAPAPDAPRVRLVATGGTISNRSSGRLTAEELINLMPTVGRYAKPEFEQFANVASSQLTLEQWLALAKRLNQLFK
jgi:L-asparaginase/Glu-tRNA(Gln) amidotransferase subunit D